MPEVKWVKLSTDLFDNRKIKHLRRLPEGNDLVLIWIMLLTLAGRCNAGGRIFLTEKVPYTPDMLADELGFEESTVVRALEAFKNLEMLQSKGAFIVLTGWEDHQNVSKLENIREQNRVRQQKHREKLKNTAADPQEQAVPTQEVTLPSRACHETEEEEEKEKEFHSFFLSAPNEEALFIEKKISDAGFTGKDAALYREELKENLRLRYLEGTLGQGLIFMSGEQFDDLCSKLSADEIEKYFTVVADCERNGKHFKKKSHYKAILEMASRDRAIAFDA